jgi:class 3 adenylate cyclase/tetratricopeptide (TPR) repeat protein
MADALERARHALEQHAFAEAAAAFAEVDAERRLEGDDLNRLAEAAWWSGDVDGAATALERAFMSYERDGRRSDAAVVALRLTERAFRRFAFPIAAGWLAQAERLLANEPEGAAHAWLGLAQMMVALPALGERANVVTRTDEVIDLARRHGNRDVESLMLGMKGQALVRLGEWDQGLALLDQATAMAVSGLLEPHSACDVYCITISACRALFDYRRASDWTHEADRFMKRNALRGYPGVCRTHRAEIKRLRGAYDEAEREARDACDELEAFRLFDGLGFAHAEIGEVRLRRGDLAGAEEAFRASHEYGHAAQPGRAMLLLAQRRVDEAAASLRRVLDVGPRGSAAQPLARSRLLPAQVEVSLAAGDVAAARTAANELRELAERFDRAALTAAATTASGLVEFAEGDAEAADTLQRAWRQWQTLDMPYEGARARLALGRALAAGGDTAGAELEIDAARSTLERLGAVIDARAADDALRTLQAGRAATLDSVSKTFVFTDIVASTDLARVLGDDAWQKLMDWHDRELRERVAAHGGELVRHTGDGIFATFDRVDDAIACALDIQGRLEQARLERGFAPSVRIGIHTATAGRHGDDYAGHGVHVAARVAASAAANEVVASVSSLTGAHGAGYLVTDTRTVLAKGVPEPLEVVTLRAP